MHYLVNPFKNIFNYSGRTSRKEFLMFQLYYILLCIFLSFPFNTVIDLMKYDSEASTKIYFFSCLIAYFVLNLSLSVRRLHDINKSGSYLFYLLIPIVGKFMVFMALFSDGDYGRNYYGDDPRDNSIDILQI